jgi:hypothetical protein
MTKDAPATAFGWVKADEQDTVPTPGGNQSPEWGEIADAQNLIVRWRETGAVRTGAKSGAETVRQGRARNCLTTGL